MPDLWTVVWVTTVVILIIAFRSVILLGLVAIGAASIGMIGGIIWGICWVWDKIRR